MTTPPYAAIIIPHYNDVARLSRCLVALLPQMRSGIELVVVDNGSSDSLEALRAVYPEVRLITETAKGAAMARNRGVRETTALRLFFLDCDCVPDPDWLDTAQRVADQADLVGGLVTVFDETPPPRTGPQAFETVFAFDNKGYIEQQGFSVTANLLTHRKVFAAVGEFTHGVSEDLDWCRRARNKGFGLIYCEALRCAHPTRSDWPAFLRKWRRLTQEMFGVNGKSPMARLRWGLRGLAMIPSIAIHLPRVLKNPRLSGPRERLAALVTLARLRMIRALWMIRQAVGGDI